MGKTFDRMTPEELLRSYHEYERMLFTGGKEYRDIPEGIFEKIEYWLGNLGYEVVRPERGLSSLRRKERTSCKQI